MSNQRIKTRLIVPDEDRVNLDEIELDLLQKIHENWQLTEQLIRDLYKQGEIDQIVNIAGLYYYRSLESIQLHREAKIERLKTAALNFQKRYKQEAAILRLAGHDKEFIHEHVRHMTDKSDETFYRTIRDIVRQMDKELEGMSGNEVKRINRTFQAWAADIGGENE